MRKPAVRSLVALCLLNLFFLTQILSLRPDLHHRVHNSAVVENESLGKLLVQGPFDLPNAETQFVPVLGWVFSVEQNASIFSSIDCLTILERGPPLLPS